MTVELVRTRTDDNVRLDGALLRSSDARANSAAWPADLVILVHGTGNNFYSPGILEHVAAAAAAAAGAVCAEAAVCVSVGFGGIGGSNGL